MTVEVSMFSCLSDNYGFLLHDVSSGLTAAIDTPEVTAINTAYAYTSIKLAFLCLYEYAGIPTNSGV